MKANQVHRTWKPTPNELSKNVGPGGPTHHQGWYAGMGHRVYAERVKELHAIQQTNDLCTLTVESCVGGRGLTGIAIRVDYQDHDLLSPRAIIIGPPGTPYEFGFFEFSVKFPKGRSIVWLIPQLLTYVRLSRPSTDGHRPYDQLWVYPLQSEYLRRDARR